MTSAPSPQPSPASGRGSKTRLFSTGIGSKTRLFSTSKGSKTRLFSTSIGSKTRLFSTSIGSKTRLFFLIGFAWCTAAQAQDRPREEDMFGGPASQPVNAQPPGKEAGAPSPTSKIIATPANAESRRDDEALSATPTGDAFSLGHVKDNPLVIGGLFYLSTSATASENTRFVDSQLHVPLLVNVYADARPTDRLRAQVLARVQFDPFLSTFGLPTATPPANPAVALDQAWLSFDLGHAVFVTAGRQHVKWGTAHIFSPTDFLASQFRDPLAIIDTRTGVTMLKASVPWEAKGWNFYAVALFEPTQLPATGLGSAGSSGSTAITALSTPVTNGGTTLGDVGGAARAEVTLGGTQIGIDGLAQKARKARAGLDITSAVGPIDLYAEAALKAGSDLPLYRANPNPIPSLGILDAYQGYNSDAPIVQAAGGMSYDIALPDNRSLTLAGEYFYNSAGYKDRHIYPWLIFQGAFQPFYNGQHYGALVATFSDNETRSSYTLSNIGNFSDLSFVTRFDFSILVMSYLSVIAFADVHYGQKGGEFRFTVSEPSFTIPSATGGAPTITPAFSVPAPIFDVGVGLKLSL